MELKDRQASEIPEGLLEAIRTFPLEREVEHCGVHISVPPFDLYAECPKCGVRLKVRAFSGTEEVEDVFDAVFEWMNRPKARKAADRRQEALAKEGDDL